MKKEKVPDSRKDFILKERPLSDLSERRLHKFLALRGHVAKELRTYTIHGKKNTPPPFAICESHMARIRGTGSALCKAILGRGVRKHNRITTLKTYNHEKSIGIRHNNRGIGILLLH
jgi:hypothetical protein